MSNEQPQQEGMFFLDFLQSWADFGNNSLPTAGEGEAQGDKGTRPKVMME